MIRIMMMIVDYDHELANYILDISYITFFSKPKIPEMYNF